MKYSLLQLKQAIRNKGYVWYDSNKPYNLNIIGIRTTEKVNSDTFNDLLYLAFRDDKLKEILYEFRFTSDAGLYYMQNPMNANGTAILVPNQYIGCWKIGLHKGEYKALVQSKPLKVYRDNDKDKEFDFDPETIEEKGLIGLNFHRANAKAESVKNHNWSAACQVLANPNDFNTFIEICEKQEDLYGNSFSYSLIKDSEV